MDHELVNINSKNEIIIRDDVLDLVAIKNLIDSWDLKFSRYSIPPEDLQAILDWNKE